MGSLFKKLDPVQEVPRLCLQALSTESGQTSAMAEVCARAGLQISEPQQAAMDFEQANLLWLSLMLDRLARKFPFPAMYPLVSPAVSQTLDKMKDTPRINWLRKGARWLYQTNDEKAFEKLWEMANVPFPFPPQGHWQDFQMQVLMRLFNSISALSQPKKVAFLRIQACVDPILNRLIPGLPHLPEAEIKSVKSGVGGVFEAMLKGKVV